MLHALTGQTTAPRIVGVEIAGSHHASGIKDLRLSHTQPLTATVSCYTSKELAKDVMTAIESFLLLSR